jgi:uncharacterized protein
LKIRVSNLHEEGVRFDFSRKTAWMESMLPADKRMDFALLEVHVDCLARKIRETVSLEMAIDTVFRLECCRCLEVIALPINSEIKYTLAPFKEGVDEENPESLDEDFNFGYYKDDEIDFDPIVVEQILMQIPMKPLCKEDCRGICPDCGVDLNESNCQCRQESGHPGFAALKNFVVQK